MGNWGLQKGELPKLLRIIFSWEDGCPRVRETYGDEVIKSTVKWKETYIVRLTAKRGELAANANGQLNPGGNCHMRHWAINSNYCWAVESWVNCQRCSWISSFSCFLGTKGYVDRQWTWREAKQAQAINSWKAESGLLHKNLFESCHSPLSWKVPMTVMQMNKCKTG